jgi:hypothetical protein
MVTKHLPTGMILQAVNLALQGRWYLCCQVHSIQVTCFTVPTSDSYSEIPIEKNTCNPCSHYLMIYLFPLVLHIHYLMIFPTVNLNQFKCCQILATALGSRSIRLKKSRPTWQTGGSDGTWGPDDIGEAERVATANKVTILLYI